MEYQDQVQQQIRQYANNALRFFPPEAHKYWMRNYIHPKVQEVFRTSDHFAFYETAVPQTNGALNILSIGSGDGQMELRLARDLIARGETNFTIHTTEISPIRQNRTIARIEEAGMRDHFDFHIVDFNKDFIPGRFDMMFAHHVLHHIVELELLFDNILAGLAPGGCFATIDMIGRNGHMRWPEALEWMDLAWNFIPDHWKHNFQFNDFHETYLNHDCSNVGFEGVRAEDILPLLTQKFAFSGFVAGGGFMDVLFDRGYGQSIDMEKPGEAALVKFLSETNELLLETGRVKPTMVFAHMHAPGPDAPAPRYWRNMTPDFAVRDPKKEPDTAQKDNFQ